MNSEQAQTLMDAWEIHISSFCPGRSSAFQLSAELILAEANQSLQLAELACGYGGWSEFMQQAAAAANRQVGFTALDALGPRLEVYRTLLGETARMLPGDLLETLPALAAEGPAFDAIFFGWAAHELASDQLMQIYGDTLRILKPGGRLLIADFVTDPDPELQALSVRLTQARRAALLADPHQRQQEMLLKQGHSHGGHAHGDGHQHGHGAHAHPGHGHAGHQSHANHPTPRHYSAQEHFSWLRRAGFAQTAEVWRYLNSSLFLAVAPAKGG